MQPPDQALHLAFSNAMHIRYISFLIEFGLNAHHAKFPFHMRGSKSIHPGDLAEMGAMMSLTGSKCKYILVLPEAIVTNYLSFKASQK